MICLSNGEEDKVSDDQLSFIESLIHNCVLGEDIKTSIENEMFEYTRSEAEKTINYLIQHQMETLNDQFLRAIDKDN